tara:strand:+ start:792 stop:1262 length:471 start_codon:yes stop_codon:yes gene_type:complete
MENKVFAILKKITKEQKTELSATSDLQDWLDINTVTGSEFDRITDAESASYNLSNAIATIEGEIGRFETDYQNMQNFQVDDFIDRSIKGGDLITNYLNLTNELGIDAEENEVFNKVYSQVTDIYPDFIDRLENAYTDAESVIDELESIKIDYITRN